MKNYIYISICCINNWKDVINNIYTKLKNYGVYNIIDEIRCVVSCKDDSFKNLNFFNDPKLVILEHFTENFGFTFEKKIMDYLFEHSKNETFNVLYLHSKGVSDRHINNKNIISWTNVMLFFCLKHYNHIINNLYKYNAIGINLILDPVLHYYGNFWWSKSSHIKNLNKCGSGYPEAEFWITSIYGNYLSLYDHNRNLYEYYLQESEYINELKNNIYKTLEFDDNLNIYYGCNNNFIKLTIDVLKKNQICNYAIIPSNNLDRDIIYGDPEYGKVKSIKINNEIYNDNYIIALDLNIVSLNMNHTFVTDKFIQIYNKNLNDNENDKYFDITHFLFERFYNNKTLNIPRLDSIINNLPIQNIKDLLYSNLYITINNNLYNYKKNIIIDNIYYKSNNNILKPNSIYYGYIDNKINVTEQCFKFFYHETYKKLIIPNCLSSRDEIFGKIEYKNNNPNIYINNIEYFDTAIILSNVKLQKNYYKSIILYSYYQRNNEYKNQTNFDYFMKYGYKTTNDTLFIIINNGKTEFCDKYIENIKTLNKTNELIIITTDFNNDFESWYYAINFIEEKYNDKIYYLTDYLCLCNCSVFGPILNKTEKEIESETDWIDIFINKLENDNAIACSPMLNYLNSNDAGGPGYRLTSYFVFIKINNIILDLLLNKKISNISNNSLNISKYPIYYNTIIGKKQNKLDTILTGEFGLSRIFIENNYNITSLVPCNNKKENIDRSFDNNKLEYTLEDLIFIKTNFRTDLNLNRDSLPIYYNECLDYYYKNLNYENKENNEVELLLNYDNLLINEKGINKYNSSFNWNSYQEFYNLYGKAENFYIFIKPNINNNRCIIIINEIDNQYLNNYLINNFNELLLLNYDIYFCTNSVIKNFEVKDVYNLFLSENCKTTNDLLINFINKNKEMIKNKYDKLSIINTNIIFGLQSFENTLNIINEYSKYDIWSIFYDNKKINNDFIEFSKNLFDELFDIILHNKYFEYDFSYLINKYKYGYIYKNIEDLSKLDIYSEFLLWINNNKIFCVNVKILEKLNLNYKKNSRLNYLLRFYI